METALHNAVIGGDERVVRDLISSGEQVDAQDVRHHFTPLHLACQKANVNIVKILLDNGANTDLHDVFGATPIHYASTEDHAEVMNVLLDHGCDPNTVSIVLLYAR